MDVDPLKRTCECGEYWYFNRWDYIRMISFGKLRVVCKGCGRVHEYRLIYHAVEEHEDTRLLNKEFKENERKLWRNG